MPFITENNAKKISSTIRVEDLPSNYPDLFGKIWKKDIWFFNHMEQAKLLMLKTFYRKPREFLSIYKKSTKHDTYSFIHEAKQSAYHQKSDCSWLHSSFTTYKISDLIRNKGKLEVISFREWYKLIISKYEVNSAKFIEDMQNIFGIGKPLEHVDAKNMGILEQENISLVDLEKRIDMLLFQASRFFVHQNEQYQRMMKKYCRYTSMSFRSTNLDDNNTGLSDGEVMSFLSDYHVIYKKPLSDDLSLYYKLRFNPTLEFDGLLLEQLNFKSCSVCE